MSSKKNNWPCILFFLAVLTLATTSVAQVPKRIISETLLTRVSVTEMKGNTYTISSDLRRIAFRLHQGDKMAAVVDTLQSNNYDDVSIPVFSPNGKHFAYLARNGSKQMLFVDKALIMTRDTSILITALIFSPDNKSLVCLARASSKYYIEMRNIANSTIAIKSKTYDFIDEHSIAFSSDKNKIAFVAQSGGKQLVVYNGKNSALFDQVGFPVLSPNGKRIAYWAINADQHFVVLKKKKSKPYDAIGSMLFSGDSKHFVYDVSMDGIEWLIVDGKITGRGYGSIHSVTLTPDGSRMAFAMTMTTTNEYNSYAVVDGKREGPYEQITPGMIFSPDGKSIAYCAQLPIHVIQDGEEIELMDIEWFMMFNGVEQKRYNMLQGHPVFSPDSKHMAYAGERESKRIINADSVEGTPFDDVYFITYTPDSKRLIYSAKDGEKDFVVVDGHIGKKYESILGQYEIRFDSPASFHYIATRDNAIYLVEEKIE